MILLAATAEPVNPHSMDQTLDRVLLLDVFQKGEQALAVLAHPEYELASLGRLLEASP